MGEQHTTHPSSILIPSTTSSTTSHSTIVTSPRNDFIVSQRAPDYNELSRLDSLSLEEQEIMANIQDLQLQLMQLRAEEEEESEEEPSSPSPPSTNQLIVVSNTLPIVLERNLSTGRWKVTKTTGGLDKLLCLTGVRNDLNFLWVGWVGQHIPKAEHESIRRLLLQHNCLPVFISSDVATRHNSFSSDVLWSLFHYVSESIGFNTPKRFNKQDWRAYESANESFADAIAEIYNEGDSVWIHDYHLMVLPSLLRSRIPKCRIGWFLHTPFPASDVYSRLPIRMEVLKGVLQSDLIGFQTFDYERHFVSTCQRLLGVETSHQGIRTVRDGVVKREHFTSTGVFPIGISIEPVARAASSAFTLDRVQELHGRFGQKRIILGVDRLDHIKGIPHKLLAMEMLLKQYPEWQHNVVLIQIGISSRSGVIESSSSSSSSSSSAAAAASASRDGTTATPACPSPSKHAEATNKASADTTIPPPPPPHSLEMSSQSFHLLSQVNQMVGRINGIYGTLDYSPIHFIQHRSIQYEELCALYDLADVCLVTSTRDGMNLVSHEFIVCQQHFMKKKKVLNTNVNTSLMPTGWEGEEGGPGVLILSEFAGCSQSLSGALVINPWNTEDVASSIHQALSMCRTERELRQQKLYRHVSSNTATAWSMQFLSELEEAVGQNKQQFVSLPTLDLKTIVSKYQQTTNRVILLDYDRTLTPQHGLFPLATVGPNFKSILDQLSADSYNTVFVVSARERKFLETWLNGLAIGVAAEDGFFYRMNLQKENEEWKTMSKFLNTTSPTTTVDASWKSLVLPTMLAFTDRTPGSYIEDKESVVTWHYDDADAQFGSWQAKDLLIHLERLLIGTALEVYHGHLSISVEHEGCTKAKVVEGILKHLSLPQQLKNHQTPVDFILCVCDDTTDDQMFQTLHTLVLESKERQENLKQQPFVLERSKSMNVRNRPHSISASSPPSRRKSDKGMIRNTSNTNRRSKRSQSVEWNRVLEEESMEEDDHVAFSRLSKVPVQLASDVAVFTVVVGSDVQHSAGKHKSAYTVENLTEMRQILKEFVEVSRKRMHEENE